MFYQGRFRVKVKVQGSTLYDCILYPLYIFLNPGGVHKTLCTNVKYDETMIDQGRFKVKVIVQV